MKIEIRLALFTENGLIAGPRLERGSFLPVKQFHFPIDEREKAEAARESLQNYVDKHHKKEGSK